MTPAEPPASASLRDLVAALTPKRLGLMTAFVVVLSGLISPIFITEYVGIVWRLMLISFLLLVAFTAAGLWPPRRVPRWVAQVVAVVLAVPLSTILLYALLVGGNWGAFVSNHGLVRGFITLTFIVLAVGPLVALAALYRERDAQAQREQLAFALEKSTLEKQALDARLKLLHAQIQPHFLFNTLANVQELVESGSSQAAPVLRSLVAYLRAAIPKLDASRSTLGNEVALVRAYLELMHMRMPDRLQYAIAVPPDLEATPFPPMALLTLVENAIHHGIDPAEQGGRIDVQARRVGGSVEVEVVDTGVGLDDTAVPGTGLANLRERLAALHGAAAELTLTENVPRGVRAALRLPAGAP